MVKSCYTGYNTIMRPKYWAYSLAYVGYQNSLYYYNTMASLVDYFSSLFTGNDTESELPPEIKDIKVDKFTCDPNKAWQTRKRSQTHRKVKPVDPETPISEDKIRFVCISDTHTHLEKSRRLKIPDGDVLLHAGDFTVYGTPDEVQIVNEYLGTLPHKHKVVIAGNHDMTFDLDFIKHKRKTWMWELTKENYEDRLAAFGVNSVHDLLTSCVYLQDSLIDIDGIKIYGSPWQPGSKNWGFSLRRGKPCLEKWRKIPVDTDILITHGPPLGHGDNCCRGRLAQLFDPGAANHIGCVDLLNIVQKIKPKYHVFGHIHEGYGITTDGSTTFINAATCDERYAPINPPVVFDLPLPLGSTKDGSLKWLIRNEPWKNKTKTNQRLKNGLKQDNDDFRDRVVFEASGDSPIIGRHKSNHNNDYDMQRFEVLESQLTVSDNDSGESDDDSPGTCIGTDKSPTNENFGGKKVQTLQSELSDSDDSIVFDTEPSK